MKKEIFKRRFDELEQGYNEIRFKPGSYSMYVPDGEWKKWATSVQNLILAVFGELSPHYKNFLNDYNLCGGDMDQVKSLHSIFLSAKEDFEGGFIFDINLRISGEVFGDFIALSRRSLLEGYKDVAAVLACAALEDVLKRYAENNNIETTEKTMQEVINALKTQGLVSGPQKSILESMPKLRNAAMHAEWEKINSPDVSSVIGFVEQFLLEKFRGD
jgi:hypothetical protein